MDDGSLRPLELKHFHRRDHGEEQLQRAIAGVIQAYTNCGQLHEATAFASRALKLPNFMPARNALPALAKDVCDELPPTSVSTLHYKALLESAARQRSVRSARSILLDMLSRELPVNSRIRSGLCRLIVSSANKDTSDMLRMLRRVLPKMQQSGDTSGVGIGDSPRNRRLIKLAEFLDRLGLMDKMILQKPKVLARASQMADQSDRETAEAMRRWALSDMSTPLGSQPQAATSTSASDGTASSQQPSTAPLAKHELLAPLDDIMDLDQPLERAAYAMRMRVFAVLRHDFDSAQRLWRSMIEHGIEPTVKHVEPLVEGLLAVSRLTDAQKLKENAVRIYGIKPSVRLHTALIRAYARDGDDRRLLRELSEFKRNGYQLDETILQIIETAHSQRHPVPVHERSVDLGDLHSVSSRFKVQMRGFAYLEAQQLVAHALDRGLVPDDVLVGFIGRSVNWLDKQCRRHPRHVGPRLSGSTLQRPLDRQELESALDLARQNLARARKVKRLTPLREKVAMRRFRRGVIELILELVDGSLKKEARRLASLRAVAPGLAQKSLIGAASRRLGSRRAQGRKVGRKEDRQPGVERAKARPRATGGGEAVPSVAKPDRRHERVAAAIGPKSADHATDCAAPGSTKEANGGIGGNLVAEVRREEWESKTRE
ncbi:uncharacterized protein PSFLO_05564 [Pseudozyma flocculosa]|uniref:Uncharacterized protein n=1 Tax=Pseudozyma flocculosa TaxID=84751 RepID=A0A5C3F6U9_9BASI|nr:uncharacterized protein PSFLO_05564 [Pseudozyma flocculosa]